MRTTDPDLYYIFVSLGTFFVLLWNFCQIKKMKQLPGKFSKKIIDFTEAKNEKIPIRTILAVIEILILTFFSYYYAGTYNVWFGKMLDMGPNYFGTALIGPFFMAVACFILGIDIIKAYDLIAPSYAFGLIAAKIGCFCAGCCRGNEWEHGLYNHQSDRLEVPVQLIETGLALIIFIFLILIRKKAKSGTLFPTFLILYSSTRFCSEFLRHEPAVLYGLKLYQWCCLAGVVFGVIFLVIALLFADKLSRFFTKDFGIGACVRKITYPIILKYRQLNKKSAKREKQVVHHKKRKKKK